MALDTKEERASRVKELDLEDLLMAVLEASECPLCDTDLRLDHVGGDMFFLAEHGMDKPDEQPIPTYLWPNGRPGEKGVFLYVCDYCGAKYEVYALQGGDWDVVYNEESSTHPKTA